MSNSDKTQTVHIPGSRSGSGSAHTDEISTQVITDTSNAQVGLLTVIEGEGKGQSRPVYSGTNQVGRSSDNRIPLDFGDKTISRSQHAIIAYDSQRRVFSIHDGGKQNPVHVNGERLEGDRRLAHGDTIRIGLTTLRFTADRP